MDNSLYSPKESLVLTGICAYLQPKNNDMILIIDPETGKMTEHRSLIDACKHNKLLRYQTLKDKKLSLKRTIYKMLWIYRVKYY
jgi:hypothetical protein